MSKKNTKFFTLHDDLARVIVIARETVDFKFSQGMNDERLPAFYESVLDFPRLSEAKYGDQNHEPRYLLIPSDATPVPEPFVMGDGRVKNFLYPVHQPRGKGDRFEWHLLNANHLIRNKKTALGLR